MSDETDSSSDGETGESPGDAPDEHVLIAERRAKLERLRAAGRDPFPPSFPAREPIADVRVAHEALEDGEETEIRHTIAGRIMESRTDWRSCPKQRIPLHAHEFYWSQSTLPESTRCMHRHFP